MKLTMTGFVLGFTLSLLSQQVEAHGSLRTCENLFRAPSRANNFSTHGPRLRDVDSLRAISRIDQLNEDHLWAVHATDHLPLTGIIEASHQPYQSPTVHFSIGQLVPPHEHGSWEQKKYAIVLPLKDLYPQVASFMALDTFTIGSVRMQARAVVVAPIGTVAPGYRVHEFDPKTTTLREAVAGAIRELGGYVLTTKQDAGAMPADKVSFEELSDRSAPDLFRWTLEGHDLNSIGFFEPLMRRLPGRSYGLHLMSWSGDAGRMGQLVVFGLKEEGFKKRGMAPNGVLAIGRAAARINITKLREVSVQMKLPPSAQKELDTYLMRVENDLLAMSPIELTKVSPEFYVSEAIKYDLSSLHKEDLDAFLLELERQAPGFIAKSGGPNLLKLAWVSVRAARLREGGGASGKVAIEKEGLREFMKQAYASAMQDIAGLPDFPGKRDLQFMPRYLTQLFYDWV